MQRRQFTGIPTANAGRMLRPTGGARSLAGPLRPITLTPRVNRSTDRSRISRRNLQDPPGSRRVASRRRRRSSFVWWPRILRRFTTPCITPPSPLASPPILRSDPIVNSKLMRNRSLKSLALSSFFFVFGLIRNKNDNICVRFFRAENVIWMWC